MEQRLNALRQAAVDHFPKNVKISHPAGGYFLWLELEPPFNTSELYRLALEQGVSIALAECSQQAIGLITVSD